MEEGGSVVRPIVAVVGATGRQGGGLIRALLDLDGQPFRIRALTRKPTGRKARRLAAAGAEVVQAELNDPKSLRRAFKGVHGAFLMTNFWEVFDVQAEIRQGRNQADAAKHCRVRHVIWSCLEDTRPIIAAPSSPSSRAVSPGMCVPQMDGKGEVAAYMKSIGLPLTCVFLSFFWENFLGNMSPQQRNADSSSSSSSSSDGSSSPRLDLLLPTGDTRLAGMAADDVGFCAARMFAEPEKYIGRDVGLCGDKLTASQIASVLTQATGRRHECPPMTPEEYRNLIFPGSIELGNFFEFVSAFEDSLVPRDPEEIRATIYPELLTFEQWASRNFSPPRRTAGGVATTNTAIIPPASSSSNGGNLLLAHRNSTIARRRRRQLLQEGGGGGIVNADAEEGEVSFRARAKKAFTADVMDKIHEQFRRFDNDGDDSIEVTKLGALLRLLGGSPSESDIAEIVGRFGDSGGRIELGEFETLIVESWPTIMKRGRQSLRAALTRVADRGGGELVNLDMLAGIVTGTGEAMTREEFDEFLVHVGFREDKHGEGGEHGVVERTRIPVDELTDLFFKGIAGEPILPIL